MSIFETLVGRWSDVPPLAAGVYFTRVTWDRSRPFVAYWRPPEHGELVLRGGDSTVWEFRT